MSDNFVSYFRPCTMICETDDSVPGRQAENNDEVQIIGYVLVQLFIIMLDNIYNRKVQRYTDLGERKLSFGSE